MTTNPLDSIGIEMECALGSPRTSVRQTDDGPIYRVSFAVTEETYRAFLLAKDCRQLILDAKIRLLAYDGNLTGGFYANQAGTLCREPMFQAWLATRMNTDAGNVTESVAAEWVRKNCGVSSRSMLDHNADAAARFSKVTTAYRNFLTGAGFGSSVVMA